MIYRNYHKHTKYSSAITPDTHIDMESYFIRAKELGHDRYFTTEHGFAGSVFEALDLQNKYGIKVIYAMEIYVVKDNKEKDAKNYHMMLICKNNNARRQLNLYNSLAHMEGFYYKPRFSLSDILSLNKDDFFVTSACVAGIARDENSVKELAIPILNHFGDNNFFWEVQNHNELIQKKHNYFVLNCSYNYGGRIIHGNDSHYIYKEQGTDRLSYLKGKGISYDDEDRFILDYPDYVTIVDRYRLQGILDENQIIDAINNTMLIDSQEYIDIDKSIKMPNIYKELTPRQRYNKLAQLIKDKWSEEGKKISKNNRKKYIESIKFEMDIVKNTNHVVHTADYFLLDYEIIKTGIEKYNGKITKTGRGSAPSFYLNKLLGFTSIDRNALDVPMFPTRFISETRLLETKSLPDIDLNLTDPEPFIKASKDILGEHGCYWMIAYGTSQESDAFRNVCRDMNIPFEEFNEVAKSLETFEKHPKWGEIIKKSKSQIGAITSISRHPCATLLLDKDIREEIGVIKSGNDFCCVMTSLESDNYKYLKNDLLTVTVYNLIYNTCEMIGIEVPEVSELISLLDDDVWKIYELGLTGTLNQTSTENGKRLVQIYKPTTYQELSAWVAAIRPGFASQLDGFLHRKPFTNGIETLDKLLYQSSKMMLYQESIMLFLNWCGLPEDETYGIIKMISKKKLKDEKLTELKSKLIKGWIAQTGTEEGFESAWTVVEQNADYSFNASHSVSVALDSIYGAWLKSKYPYEYYTVAFNMYESDTDMTSRLSEELRYFHISLKNPVFRESKGGYSFNKELRQITKGIGSMKGFNSKVGDQLYDLRNNKYNNFLELLIDIKEKTSCTTAQLDMLIKLDFFSEFGKSKKLLTIVELSKYLSRAQMKKSDIEDSQFHEDVIAKYSEKTTEKLYKGVRFNEVISEYLPFIDDEDIEFIDKLKAQRDGFGYLDKDMFEGYIDANYCIIKSIDKRFSPKLSLQSLSGLNFLAKITKSNFNYNLKENDLIYIKRMIRKPASVQTGLTEDGKPKWEKDPIRKDNWIEEYDIISCSALDK